MSRVPTHTPTTAPQGSRETLEGLERRMGKVLNIHGAMANSPVLLDLYALVEGHLATNSSLGEDVRQAIHLAVAAENECDYCQAAYTGAAVRAGLTVEQTIGIRRGVVDDRPDLTAVLRLTREIAANKGYVDDATWRGALDAGWSTEQLLEAYAEVVRTVLTNYFNHMVGVELDLRPAPALD